MENKRKKIMKRKYVFTVHLKKVFYQIVPKDDKFDKLIKAKKSIVLESTVSGNYHKRVIEFARK